MARQNAIQQPTEVLLEEIDLENQIKTLLDDTQLYFDYVVLETSEEQSAQIRLDLITINQEHTQKFLFHSLKGKSKVSILKEMIQYIQEYKKHLEIYAIEWKKMTSDDKIQTSWFRGNDIFDVLHKFYYDKEKSQFKIFKIKLMPEA